MSIIQISKIQQRAGDLVDLPQLDEAEFGFASDVNRLFIGKTSGNVENVEILTAYSNISFSQLDGAVGNLDITAPVANGEVLVFDGSNWVNRGGDAGGYINLGEASNVAIEGGAVGYILTTDGIGNLSWSPKGIVSLPIQTISAASPGRITLQSAYPLTQAVEITFNGISGSTGTYATNLNGNIFYLKTVPGNLQLYDIYQDEALTIPQSTAGYGTYPTNTGLVLWNTVSANANPGGANGSVQFNSAGAGFGGDAELTYNYITNQLTLLGNGVFNNVYANTGMIAAQNLKGEGGNISNIQGANISGAVASATTAGTVTTAAQPNITSVGTLSALSVTGKITAGQLQGDGGNISNIQGANVSGTVASATTAGTVTTAAQPNITSVGTLSSLAVSGTVTLTTLTTGGSGTAGTITGNWTLSSGSRLQATYADLAEYYAADKKYEPGTVLEFGGENEVTSAGIESNKIAGVVSSEPAYVMNTNIQAEHPVAIALIGRVPVKVIGIVPRGSMLISAGNGLAKASIVTPKIGTVIGKAITSKSDDGVGTVEALIGRM